jgi:tetratricopeptide (TPR) repeat protein
MFIRTKKRQGKTGETIRMFEQLGLFGEENTVYNEGIEHLLEFRFSLALDKLRDYSRFFPWAREVLREIEMAGFWMERLGRDEWDPSLEEDPLRVYGLWLEFENAFGYPWEGHRVEHKFQTALFSRLAEGVERRFDLNLHALPGGTPMGLFFLRAGDVERAVTRLQAHIRAEPLNPLALGYLGDAHMLRADREAALACYQRAFAFGPGQVDRDHILCPELMEALRQFESEQVDEGRSIDWFAVSAQLGGFFKPVILDGLEEVKAWHKRFCRLLEGEGGRGKGEDPRRGPMLFFHAMVLSDNAHAAVYAPGLDLIELRKTMKEIDEHLFSLHIRRLREREQEG